jgi:hypothetical protein
MERKIRTLAAWMSLPSIESMNIEWFYFLIIFLKGLLAFNSTITGPKLVENAYFGVNRHITYYVKTELMLYSGDSKDSFFNISLFDTNY